MKSVAGDLQKKIFTRHIEMAAYFGSPIVRMVIDGNDYYPELDTILSVIRNSRQELESKGIILAIENHDRLHASVFQGYCRVIRQQPMWAFASIVSIQSV